MFNFFSAEVHELKTSLTAKTSEMLEMQQKLDKALTSLDKMTSKMETAQNVSGNVSQF